MTRREVAGVAVALVGGAVIAVVDSAPRYDSTAVTVVALVGGAAAAAAVSGARPWLIALLVGLPTPVVEIAGGGNVASLAAIAFAAIGAIGGWLVGVPRAQPMRR